MNEILFKNGTTELNGQTYWIDAKGALVPEKHVLAQDKLTDEVVRKIISYALPLSSQVARFRAHTMADLSGLDELLEQHYNYVKKGNRSEGKGNRSYISYDGLLFVDVCVSPTVVFGAELQVAKKIIDECLIEWTSSADEKIQLLIQDAFNTDNKGQISRSKICQLLRLPFDDPRWLKAMEAIIAAQRVIGKKEYIHMKMKDAPEDEWTSILIKM